MTLNNSDACSKCKYYTDTIGENGYCRFYRHNIATPSVRCSNYQEEDDCNVNDASQDVEVAAQQSHRGILSDYKTVIKRLLFTASFFGCMVFVVLAAIFGVTIGTAIMSFGEIDLTMRIVFLLTVCFFLISALLLAFMLVYRFTAMRIVFILASLFCVVFMLLNNTLLWFNFHDLIMNMVEEIFNIVY